MVLPLTLVNIFIVLQPPEGTRAVLLQCCKGFLFSVDKQGMNVFFYDVECKRILVYKGG